MVEYIGNVKLDYTYYSGEDIYCDGPIEDEMLELARTGESENDIINMNKQWPIIYHFSHIRSNIVEWLPIKKTDRVLEIGAGCGAITGMLSHKALSVDCIELSKKRSTINAYRNKRQDNISIMVGNFLDIESNIDFLYDYITLIGVFEYAELYISGSEPYKEFLIRISKHLKKNGKIILAIENKFGLKYWAGCREDHIGEFYEGIEGYPQNSGIRTFSKPELEEIFEAIGFINYDFYYPYPDYKFPMVIYSDAKLPQIGELSNYDYNMDRDRIKLFNEGNVFNSLIKDKMFTFYSNSYLVVLEKGD